MNGTGAAKSPVGVIDKRGKSLPLFFNVFCLHGRYRAARSPRRLSARKDRAYGGGAHSDAITTHLVRPLLLRIRLHACISAEYWFALVTPTFLTNPRLKKRENTTRYVKKACGPHRNSRSATDATQHEQTNLRAPRALGVRAKRVTESPSHAGEEIYATCVFTRSQSPPQTGTPCEQHESEN